MSTKTSIETQPAVVEAPSLRTLAKTTAIAFVVALILLVTIVLPAEYAVDPIGTGKMLGLTEIAAPTTTAIELKDTANANAPLVPKQIGPVGKYPAEYKYDVVDLVLGPYEYVEYKYRLEQGATMLFSWTASGALKQDFHGERDGGTVDGKPAEETYDKEDRRQATGSFAAPFPGIHGWYFENPGGTPISIRLTSSGFFSGAVEIGTDRSRKVHQLRALNTLAPLSAGTTGTP